MYQKNDDILVLMLGYKAKNGKDTFYSFAKEYGYQRLAFANKLKSVVSDLYNLTIDQVHGELKEVQDSRYKNLIDTKILLKYEEDEYGPMEWEPTIEYSNPDYTEFLTPRRILQVFGQQQRKLYPDIWASYVFDQELSRLVKEGHRKFIVTDFRFKNEAEVAKRWKNKSSSNKLKFIKITRPSIISTSLDISENDLNDFNEWDLELLNNSTLEDFKNKVINTIVSI